MVRAVDRELLEREASQARLSPEAFGFIFESLNHVIRDLPERRHISGGELVDGLCQLARERYDYLAPAVLESWGLSRPQDVGRAVFLLVQLELMSKQDEDTPADFDLPESLRERLHRGLDHLSNAREELGLRALS